jgi:hypothetical protein
MKGFLIVLGLVVYGVICFLIGFYNPVNNNKNYNKGFNDAMHQRIFISTPDTNVKYNLEWKMVEK